LKKTLSILTLFLLLSSTGNSITLKEAEELSVKNYPEIKKLELLRESSFKEAEAVRRERLGTVNLLSTYTTYNKNFILTPMDHMMNPKTPPPFDSQKFIYGISYTAPIYLGGTISRREEISKLKSELFKNLKDATAWQIRFNVDSFYLTYLKLEKIKGALKKYRDSLKKLYSDVSYGVKLGKFAKVDLLKVEYSLKDVESRISEVEENQKTIKTVLETFIGRKISKIEPYRFEYSPKNFELTDLYSEALKRNSLIKSKERNVKISEKTKKLTASKYGLNFLISGTYTRNYGFDSGENIGVGSLSFEVRYPIFEWGRKRREVLSKELEKLSKEKELKSTELEIKRELSKAIGRIKSIQSDIEAYRKKLDYAKEVERIERLKYKSGKGDMDHLLLAESHLYMTEAELSGAYYDWEIEKRRIETILEVEDEEL
jgi:outer membrane protein